MLALRFHGLRGMLAGVSKHVLRAYLISLPYHIEYMRFLHLCDHQDDYSFLEMPGIKSPTGLQLVVYHAASDLLTTCTRGKQP
jgi:hypothetical protein